MRAEHCGNGIIDRQVALLMVAAAALVIAGAIFFRPPAASQATGQYFYDLGTRQIYATGADAVPPQPAPSGDMGVLAVVYSCSTCDDAASHRIAYLQKYTDDYRRELTSGQPPRTGAEIAGTLIRAVDDETWAASNSDSAAALLRRMESACADTTPQFCLPAAP